MGKIFKSYDELIVFLRNEKNLIINDSNYALQILTKTSYFSLISGYKSSFKNPTTGKYIDGTTFEDIYHLYRYTVTKKNLKNIQKLIHVLSYHITHDSDYACITHYKNRYQNIPLWIMIQILTLGQLSHMYDYLNASVPIKVCQDFHNIDRKNSITDTGIHKKLQIPQINSRFQNGKTDVFSEVIILKYLLDKEDFRNFYYELKRCLKKHQPDPKIIKQMGFPENWMLILRLRP